MKKIILVVEDEQSLLKVITKTLEKNGFDVLISHTAEHALELLREHKVDVIWLDHYLLGESSGLDLVFSVRSDESKLKDIPIFVVSNNAAEENIKYYMKLGVEQYHTKSNIRLDFLVDEIKKVVGV